MKKFAVLMLTLLIVICGMTACKKDRSADEPELNLVGDHVILAFEGQFSDEKLREAIVLYRDNVTPFVATESEVSFGLNDNPILSFDTGLSLAHCSVPLLSCVDDSDIEVERTHYIDLLVDVKVDGGRISVDTDWWYYGDGDSGVDEPPLWSYLIRAVDTDGNTYYYYTRVQYTKP